MIEVILVLPFIAALLWLLAIRPYCRRNGKGYTTGANAGVTFWVDWQEAKEHAKSNGHGGMIAICNSVLGIFIFLFAAILYSIFVS